MNTTSRFPALQTMLTSVIILLLLFLSTHSLHAQNWVKTWQESKNFYTIRDSFNAYCKQHINDEREPEEREVGEDKGEVEDEGLFPGYVQFKRWEAYVEPRVYPSGDITLLGTNWSSYQAFISENNSNLRNTNGVAITSPPWVAKGPFGPLCGLATNGLPRKAGRLNFVTYLPGNPNTFWVGAAEGGLWKTTDGGISWTTNTDNLDVIGCTDLAIDPTNPSIMYLGTGDGYGSFRSPSSIGVLRSTDGGNTWLPTGLVFNVSAKVEIHKIIINPLFPNIIMCASSSGIWRNTNSGTGTWTQVLFNNTYDLEFKPGSSDTIYASGFTFRRSVNGGVSFTQISSGIPTSGSTRMEIGTTPADPNLVYVVSSNSGSAGLQGVYRSTDGGTNFTLRANSPDIVASDCFITSSNGQGWYDLAIDASPLNPSEVVVGGLGVWRSMDGGTTWSNIGCAYNWSSPVPYVHTDHQELEYTAAGVLYSINDGGVFQYTGTQWNDLSSPMNISMIYKIGMSGLNPNLWITGHQDNGSNIFNNNTYCASLAADGGDCFIDRTNDNYMFASITQGKLNKSTNGGANWNACINGLPAIGGWITPWKQDPATASTLYCGMNQMYRSVNYANSWTAVTGVMSPVVSTEFITEFAIAPSNNQYIYAIHGTSGVFVSTNAGTSWTASNTNLPITLASGSFITIDPANPLVAWVTFSGYSSGNKVFKTTTGGTSWQNISYNLPNLPANCSVFETGSTNGRIYVGTDLGVYWIDNSSSLWTIYNTSLPNVPVWDMEISAADPTKITAATFGRGVYQTDVLLTTGTLFDGDGGLSFNLFPNPANDVLHVNVNCEKENDLELEIRTITGELVLKQSAQFDMNKHEALINISALASGIYFFTATAKSGIAKTLKLIKQ
jgi:photosystem II stability/assembly factor-like uncharacterized protein